MKFAIYLVRWVFSGIVMAIPFNYLSSMLGDTENMVVCSVIGACIFWFIDKRIFDAKEQKASR